MWRIGNFWVAFFFLYIQDASIDPSEVFNRIVSSVCILLTKDEVYFIFLKFGLEAGTRMWQHHVVLFFLKLVATLHGCTAAICDRIKQSAEGAIQAVIEFVTKRGNELSETDVSRFLVYKFSRNSSSFKLLTVICKYFVVRVIFSVSPGQPSLYLLLQCI